MKKLLMIVLTALCLISGAVAGDTGAVRIEKNMVLPDGKKADVYFFEKWAEANRFIKFVQPQDKKTLIGVKAETEADVGYLRKTYKAGENPNADKILAIHNETAAAYSVAWVEYNDHVTRCVFTFKKNGLVYDRMDFFDENSKTYKTWKNK